MNFTDIVDRIEQGNLSPSEITEYRGFCATWLFRYYEMRGKLKAERALWQTANRNSYKSMAECERAWDSIESGQELLKITETVNGLERVSEFLTSLYFQTNKEMQLASRDYGQG